MSYTKEEFQREYKMRLENKERQLWECLSLRYDPHSGFKKMTDDESYQREKERCERELEEVRTQPVYVILEYKQERKTEYKMVGNEFKRYDTPSKTYTRRIEVKSCDVEDSIFKNEMDMVNGQLTDVRIDTFVIAK